MSPRDVSIKSKLKDISPWGARLRQWAQALYRDIHVLRLAARDPRLPWHVKLAALCVAFYVLSPIDLIPDFIPVVGYLDELIIVPLGIFLVVKLIPAVILAEHRAAVLASGNGP